MVMVAVMSFLVTLIITGLFSCFNLQSWENTTDENRRIMTVKRTLPSQVYINPPVAIISPAATIDSDNPDFDDLIYALKLGRSLTPSEFSRSFDDDMSQLSVALEQYETKRINIADTHV